jgi:hypothetical protein
MAALMKDNGLIIRLTDLELIFGKTVVNTTDSGLIMICKAMASTSTLMVSDMMANTLMIKRKATDCTIGLMAENTRGGGTKASSTVWALILTVQSNQ